MKENVKHGIFGYTDGGANPNPGPTGGGAHVYHFYYPTDEEKPTSFGRFIATDAGYLTQKDFEAMKPKDRPSPVVITKYVDIVIAAGHGTNNIGEMLGMLAFIDYALEEVKAAPGTYAKIHAISDSKLVVAGVSEYLPNWLQRNWLTTNGTPVANREIWESINTSLTELKALASFSCSWVLGHNDDHGNTHADILASLGVNYSANGNVNIYKTVYEKPKDFHDSKLDTHPYFCLQRVYFNSVSDQNTKGVYYQTSGGDAKFVTGKRSGDTAYSVIKLQEDDPYVSAVVSAAARDNDVNTVLYFRLARIKEQSVKQCFENHGVISFSKDRRNFNLNFMDKKPVVIGVEPGELPLRTIETLEFLELIVDNYATHLDEGTEFNISGTQISLLDVTDTFYTTKTKGKLGAEVEICELRKEFGVGSPGAILEKDIELAQGTKRLKFNLLFGIDLPFRNSMRKIEASHPVVQLVIWSVGEEAVRYATIIRTDEAVGIWSNYHANLLLI